MKIGQTTNLIIFVEKENIQKWKRIKPKNKINIGTKKKENTPKS